MAKEVEVEVLKPLNIKGSKTIQPGAEGIKLIDDESLKTLVAKGAVKLKIGDKK